MQRGERETEYLGRVLAGCTVHIDTNEFKDGKLWPITAFALPAYLISFVQVARILFDRWPDYFNLLPNIANSFIL